MENRKKTVKELIDDIVRYEKDYSSLLDGITRANGRSDLRPTYNRDAEMRAFVLTNTFYANINALTGYKLDGPRDSPGYNAVGQNEKVLEAINNMVKCTADYGKYAKGLGNYTGLGGVIGTRKIGFAVTDLFKGKERKANLRTMANELEQTVESALSQSNVEKPRRPGGG